jgi:hypothetical protein
MISSCASWKRSCEKYGLVPDEWYSDAAHEAGDDAALRQIVEHREFFGDASHRAAFEALTSGDYGNFALCSCFVNREPAAAIVAVKEHGDSYKITPLFVNVTPSLELTDHDGHNAANNPSVPVP